MIRPARPNYAARLNAFRHLSPGSDVTGWIAAAGRIEGLGAADLNFPDHLETHGADIISGCLRDAGLDLNGLAMRYYTDRAFRLGAFTHPDSRVRQAAVDLTRRGIDTCLRMGGKTITLWMGQDGFDYAFQLDYGAAWDNAIAAISDVCAHDRSVDIAIEYKPNEPRAYSLMPDIGTTLLACREVAAPNLGVTLDFAHTLYADEMPAHSAALIGRHSRLIDLHLYDGYGKRGDGLGRRLPCYPDSGAIGNNAADETSRGTHVTGDVCVFSVPRPGGNRCLSPKAWPAVRRQRSSGPRYGTCPPV